MAAMRCFVVMPFGEDGTSEHAHWSQIYALYEGAIEAYFGEHGCCERASANVKSGDVVS